MRTKNQKIVDDIEFISTIYHNEIPTFSVHNRNLLERRWHAYKFILLGIHNEAENHVALTLVERLMDISNSKHENDKDTFLLKELAKVIMKFEKKMYPGVSKK